MESFVSCVYFLFVFSLLLVCGFFNIYFFSIIITAVCNQAVTIRCMLSPKYLGLDWIGTFHMVWTVSSTSFGFAAIVLSPPGRTSPCHHASLRRWKSLDHEVTKRKSNKETFPSLISRAASRLCSTRVQWLYLHMTISLNCAQFRSNSKLWKSLPEVLEPVTIVNYYIEFKMKLLCSFEN